MGDPTEDWQRLARYVFERRTELGLTQQDVRAAGGPGTATQAKLEGGRPGSYKPHVLASLERALQWRPGSVRAVLAGNEPVTNEAAAREEMARERAGRTSVADIARHHDEILAEVREFLADADEREERTLLGMLEALRQGRRAGE